MSISRAGAAAIIGVAFLFGPIASAQPAPGYEYSGVAGPDYWKETSGWEACGRGDAPDGRQTPIDIEETRFDRTLAPLALTTYPTAIRFRNNGHTIEQEYEPGSYIISGGVPYALAQFHFHTLSEHAFGGRRSAMELHAVFRNATSGKIVVVGQPFVIGPSNAFLAALFSSGAPRRSGDVVESETKINIRDAFVDVGDYATYEGSLTTPPCSEVVTWFVLRRPATLSRSQFDAINDIVGNNFRPLQPISGRIVRASRPGPFRF